MEWQSPEESALVAQAQRDPRAFRDLYRQYFPRVYTYVMARVGNEQDAEDLVSEIFLAALESLPHFHYRGAGSFSAWLFGIAHHRLVDFYRRTRRTPVMALLDEIPDLVSDTLPPDHVLMQKETFLHIHHAIASLPRRRQEVVTLKYFGGLRNREIAEALNLDERTVASHLHRALVELDKKCRLLLAKDGVL